MNLLKCILIVLAAALLVNFTVPHFLGIQSLHKLPGLINVLIFLSIFEALTLGYIQYVIFYRNQNKT